jgi:hypothetical protein
MSYFVVAAVHPGTEDEIAIRRCDHNHENRKPADDRLANLFGQPIAAPGAGHWLMTGHEVLVRSITTGKLVGVPVRNPTPRMILQIRNGKSARRTSTSFFTSAFRHNGGSAGGAMFCQRSGQDGNRTRHGSIGDKPSPQQRELIRATAARMQ